jgi:hypothetical protein
MLFTHLKRILRFDRLRLRGPSGARDEVLLAATACGIFCVIQPSYLDRRGAH